MHLRSSEKPRTDNIQFKGIIPENHLQNTSLPRLRHMANNPSTPLPFKIITGYLEKKGTQLASWLRPPHPRVGGMPRPQMSDSGGDLARPRLTNFRLGVLFSSFDHAKAMTT